MMEERVPLLPSRHRTQKKTWAFVFGGILGFLSVLIWFGTKRPPAPHFPGITSIRFEEGRSNCVPSDYIADQPIRTKNSRVSPKAKPTLLRRGTLATNTSEITDIFLRNGIIAKIGPLLLLSDLEKEFGETDIQIIDLNLAFVTAGLVDMHSHAGVGSWPGLEASDDVNEETIPTAPFLRSLDSFDPNDPAIQMISAGGVTTSLILPGSGNVIGGEAYVIKHRIPDSSLARDMLFTANMTESEKKDFDISKWLVEKIPKVYGNRNQTPASRMGVAWLLRDQFQKAKELKEKQDDWCSLSHNLYQTHGNDAHRYVPHVYPSDSKFETLVSILRGNVHVNVHCYETHDIEMMVRLSEEFNFNVTAFHHALEAWKVADLLGTRNIGAAIFADHWAYKKEAYGTSVHAPSILNNAGVPVAFKSDHPVINSQHLLFEAQKAYRYGYSPDLALKGILEIPASLIKAGHRVGSIQEGFDADVVVWNKFPLMLSATPLKVFIDGEETYQHPFYPLKSALTTIPKANEVVSHICETQPNRHSYVLENLNSVTMNEKTSFNGNVVMYVEQGIVKCVGRPQDCQGIPKDVERISTNGGVIVPGMVAGHCKLGLSEIPSEQVTSDGVAKGLDESLGGPQAVDGLKVGLKDSRIMNAAYKGGILTSVSVPKANGVIAGHPVGFRLGASSISDSIIVHSLGITVTIGNGAKGTSGPSDSISGGFGHLKRLLKLHGDTWGLSQNKTLFVKANEKNDIERAIWIKREFTKLKMTIVGGAEAWLFADELAALSIGVLLQPARCTAGEWDTRKCLHPNGIGTGLNYGMGTDALQDMNDPKMAYPAATILSKAGVKVGLSLIEDNFFRGLMWEAAWVYGQTQDANRALKNMSISLSASDALGMVTWNVGDLMGLPQSTARIEVGKPASFIMYGDSHHPIENEMYAKVTLIADSGKLQCHPIQE